MSLSKLSPWIEQLIWSYGSDEGSSGAGQLRAHVIGVGQLSSSQAQSCGRPTGLLFLSDGALQIPAILTASAWENLQEQEDRECFTSLVNTTVKIQDYQLHFHMAPEKTRCRFFLSVGDLATSAAGEVNGSTPCCTTAPLVRLKIVNTWRARLGVEDSQRSQCASGFDLSELLGQWQHDHLQAVLQDVRERVTAAGACPRTLQPSTSVSAHPDAVAATGWDVDRVRYKDVKRFSVPVKFLFVPEDDAPQLPAPPSGRAGDAAQLIKPADATGPPAGDARWQTGAAAEPESGCSTMLDSPPLPEDGSLHEHLRPAANPWDIFPPPCVISSSDSSPEATAPHSLHEPKCDGGAILTSTQLPVHNSKESQQASEHSFFPLYQKPPDPTSLCTAGPTGSRSEQESQVLAKHVDISERTQGNAKRSELAPVELQVSRSPPSWLFETQPGCGEHSAHRWPQAAGAALGKTGSVHSDGSPFSYTYQVTGLHLQHFSRFTVDEALLQWAVKILVVPKPTEDPRSTSASSCQAQEAM